MKKLVTAFLPLLIASTSYAQPVFTYGKKAVTKEEFLRAFNKSPNTVADRKKALKEYLDLYINFKLKVQAAYDAKLNEDPNQQFELDNFKKQIAENFINEEANVSGLVKEAFQRSQKDIHVAQVFIEVPPNADTAEAYSKINAAYNALRTGNDFGKVSEEFSNDVYTKQTAGDMGFVTVFTLPYEIENIVYSLAENTFSKPYRSKVGYHIFKNTGERKSIGTRKVAQILIPLPPGANEEQRAVVSKYADSAYKLLLAGASFESMVKAFSNDINNANPDGALQEFGPGEYSAAFEQVAFSLKSPGEISMPFTTTYGYHIIKLLEARNVSADEKDALTTAYLKEKVQQNERLAYAKKLLTSKHLSLIKYKPAAYNSADLWKFTDSFIANKKTEAIKTINDKTLLFSFAKQSIKAGDWVRYAKAMRAMPNEMSAKSYPELMKEYVKITGEEYYRNHLEDYNQQYVQQINEFREANLLFGIMDQNVWAKASVDSTGLQDYYRNHKAKYQWTSSADALIVTADSKETAEDLQKKLLADIKNWRAITEAFGSRVTADSSRYELGQLPVTDRTNFTDGIATTPVKREPDNSYTFNYIFKVYDKGEQRSFEDARGMVTSDYQQVLEDKWLAELRKKYPVTVNQAVFASLK